MERFEVVSVQGDDEEGAKVLNVRIWVGGAVLECELHFVAKTPGGILIIYRHTGGAPGCQQEGKSYIGNSMRDKVEGVL